MTFIPGPCLVGRTPGDVTALPQRPSVVGEILRALPIRTLTVGAGISPTQPVTGCDRVADFNRRCGISPPPEHASLLLVADKGATASAQTLPRRGVS